MSKDDIHDVQDIKDEQLCENYEYEFDRLLQDREAVTMVAVTDEEVVGYAFGYTSRSAAELTNDLQGYDANDGSIFKSVAVRDTSRRELELSWSHESAPRCELQFTRSRGCEMTIQIAVESSNTWDSPWPKNSVNHGTTTALALTGIAPVAEVRAHATHGCTYSEMIDLDNAMSFGL